MIRYLALFVALLPLACSSCTPVAPLPIGPEPPQPDPTTVVVTVVDGGAEPTLDAARLDACGKACVHLRAIRCPDGNPTQAGSTCEQVCRTDKTDPVARLTPKYLACLASVKACADEVRCAR